MVPDLPKAIFEHISSFTGRTWLLAPIIEWMNTEERLFLLSGEPGTGKSMIAAWLSGAGPQPTNSEQQKQLDVIRKSVAAIHFCQVNAGSTSPKALAKNMAEQLVRNIPGFGEAIAATMADQIKIQSTQNIGPVESGASVTGVYIEHLNLYGMDDEPGFNRVLVEPLHNLYKSGYNQPMLLIVDALDEAITYTGPINIVQLLARLDDLSPQIRILATTRPDPRVFYIHHHVKPYDLVKNAPIDIRDVEQYAYERLTILNSADRKVLAERIGEAADGIFLYAHLLLNDLLLRLPQIPDVQNMPLPEKLAGLYHEFLNREFSGKNRSLWFSPCRPLLGLIGVGQGPGLGRTLLDRIVHQDLEPALEITKQYLDGELPDGPFRLFHKSFIDFLLRDKEKNLAFRIDAAQHHGLVADHYWSLDDTEPWRKWDDYGLRYIVTHQAEYLAESDPASRFEKTKRLVNLTCQRSYQQRHAEIVSDPVALESDLRRSLHCVAANTDPDALPLLIEAALELVTFRQSRLQPQPLFDWAKGGALGRAETLLGLFGLEPKWHRAALLVLAWLATEKNPSSAKRMCDRLEAEGLSAWPLSLLRARVNHALGGPETDLPSLPDAPQPEIAREIVLAMGGEGVGRGVMSEYLASVKVPPSDALRAVFAASPDDLPAFLAERDGPILVACAKEYPPEGNRYLEQYINIHAANGYLYYRNLSLWILLDSVLRHPDGGWVLDKCCQLLLAALGTDTQIYRDGLAYTILALQAKAGESNARQTLEQHRTQAVKEAIRLIADPHESDPWATHKRQLAALAQALSLFPDRQHDVEELLGYAQQLGKGFAGFQAPAWLTLAETIHICDGSNTTALDQCLKHALEAAHNVQEPVFCAVNTARVNAMNQRRWQERAWSSAIESLVQKFCESKDDPQFASLHTIGEQYSHRQTSPDKIKLPWIAQHAQTLRHLSEVYRQPVEVFLQLNRDHVWAPDDTLAIGTEINIPDPGFAPLLAARFAAEICVNTSLSPEKKTALIQMLVPIAVDNVTTLDTTLSRLLLVAQPKNLSMLQQISELHAPRVTELSSNHGDKIRELRMMNSQHVNRVSGHIIGGRVFEVTERQSEGMERQRKDEKFSLARFWQQLRSRLKKNKAKR